MPRKPERKPDDPEQSKRFIDTAKEIGADDPKALDRVFKKVATSKPPKARQERSDN
jgi:hypothetical protein